MSHTNLLLGPPGTGKTTTLINKVREAINQGVLSERICYVAFTRKAANEAISRTLEAFNGFTVDDLPYFRTLHSLAFKQLGLSRTDVMSNGDRLNVARALAVPITFTNLDDDNFAGFMLGDRLFFTENLARSRMLTIKEQWEDMPNEFVPLEDLEQFEETLAFYKQQNNKVDYTDMIVNFCKSDNVPSIDLLIVDEAQDLSPVQWKMIEHIKFHNPNLQTYIAGDDDQAIFRWAGADVDHFIDLPNDSEQVLDQSYRVPENIFNLAKLVVNGIDMRKQKIYQHRAGDKGEVSIHNSIDEINMLEGSWLLLARNSYLLKEYCEYCTTQGYVFESMRNSPVSDNTISAIKTWEELRKGRAVQVKDIKLVYEYLSTKIGVKYGFKKTLQALEDDKFLNIQDLFESHGLLVSGIWHEALDKIPATEQTYLLAARKQGEKVLAKPRIKISTIHGAKGGEADNVVLFLDMAQRTYNEFLDNPDDEHRVWYVAVTRAKKRLFIIQPKTERFYDLGRASMSI